MLEYLSHYLQSYVSWSSIVLGYGQHYAFVRNYVSDIVNKLQHTYFGHSHRQPIENYVVWFKLDLQLATIFKDVRLNLHALLANDSLTSSEISKHFTDIIQTDLKNKNIALNSMLFKINSIV